ncbi:DUF4167 domain-containing protein [Oecophyllibacter saccharovorans]|uniref:DUF4167 domain-containing protein n=1 Tax=Oecophyllibacter saccharovorans TaxID=2558360 RepID=UPI001143EAB8|nr:DUF4167 domain-containing protein [Oecophyllibacter saccharovorans]QDH14593.1 DUF4167 domain-containing protein [Oecophyllibacter saccharovorans]
MKRMRSRHSRAGNGAGSSRSGNGQVPLNRNHVFESNGPDLRVRGTAQQLFEKYLQLGRDATGTGDRIQAEAYFQHAEHYFRILNAMNQAAQAAQQERAERQRVIEQNRRERREAAQVQQQQGQENQSGSASGRERAPSEERGTDRKETAETD